MRSIKVAQSRSTRIFAALAWRTLRGLRIEKTRSAGSTLLEAICLIGLIALLLTPLLIDLHASALVRAKAARKFAAAQKLNDWNQEALHSAQCEIVGGRQRDSLIRCTRKIKVDGRELEQELALLVKSAPEVN